MPPVERAAVVTHGRDERRRRGGRRGCGRSPPRPASSCSSTRTRPSKHGVEPRDGPPPTSRSCSAATARCCAALTRFLDTGVPVLGVNFGRVGFLTAIAGDELEAGPRARLRRRLPRDRAADARRSSSTARRHAAVNDTVVASGTPGRMIELEWSIGGEDLGMQPCDGADLRDAVRLDRLQPLERRPGARVGPRRDGGHVRRAALAARAPARRRPRHRPRRHEPLARRRRRSVLVDGHRSASLAPAASGARAPRPGAQPARDAAGADVLPPLRRRLRRR